VKKSTILITCLSAVGIYVLGLFITATSSTSVSSKLVTSTFYDAYGKNLDATSITENVAPLGY
jgi:hypothetical protein